MESGQTTSGMESRRQVCGTQSGRGSYSFVCMGVWLPVPAIYGREGVGGRRTTSLTDLSLCGRERVNDETVTMATLAGPGQTFSVLSFSHSATKCFPYIIIIILPQNERHTTCRPIICPL